MTTEWICLGCKDLKDIEIHNGDNVLIYKENKSVLDKNGNFEIGNVIHCEHAIDPGEDGRQGLFRLEWGGSFVPAKHIDEALENIGSCREGTDILRKANDNKILRFPIESEEGFVELCCATVYADFFRSDGRVLVTAEPAPQNWDNDGDERFHGPYTVFPEGTSFGAILEHYHPLFDSTDAACFSHISIVPPDADESPAP